MMNWQFRLFGKPEVWHGKHQIEDFNTQKTQALLLYLIAEGCTQNRNELARFFWDDFNLISSQNNLRTALYHLKQDFDACLEIDRQTVCFHLPDSAYFDLDLVDAISPDADKQALVAAADAYRGDFLEGFNTPIPAFTAWKEGKQAHYRQLIINHLLRLVKLFEQDQQLQQGLRTAEQILKIDPANEAAVLSQMRLNSQLGRQEQALQAYRTYQNRLKQHPEVTAAPLLTEFYGQLKAPPPNQASTSLPSCQTRFFGREEETRQLTRWLTDPSQRWVNLVGPSGVGKTRLALHAAESVATHFKDGVRYIDLQGIDAADADISIEYTSKIALYLFQVKLILGQSYTSQWFEALRQREMVLILDNYEPLEWRVRFATEMVRTIPTIKLLAISRQPFNLPDGAVMQLKGLAYPNRSDLPPTFDPGLINRFSSLQLFEDRAQQVQPGFTIDQSNYRQVAHICQAVQGLPLGVEFFASLLRSTSLERIMHAFLGDSSAGPAAPVSSRLPKELETVFDYLWANLPLKTREITLACTLFKGSFTIEDFAAVTGEPTDWLPTLVETSLLHISVKERFSLHDLVQTYLNIKNIQLPQEYPDRYSDHFLKKLIQLDEAAQSGPYPIETFGAEYADLLHAWGLALAQGQYPLLAEACGPLSRAFEQLGMAETGLAHFSDTAAQLEALPAGSKPLKLALGGVLLAAARLALECGRVTEACTRADQAQDIARALDDPALLAAVLQHKAVVSIQAGDDQPVTKLAYEGLTQAVRSGHTRLVASGITVLGEAYCKQHQYQKARKLFKTAFDEHLVEDDSRMMQTLLLKLSQCEKELGYFNISMGINRKAQRLNQNFQNLSEEALLAFARGECLKYLGQLGPAFDEFQQAHDTFATINHPRWQARSLANLGILHFWQGEYSVAIDQLDAAENLVRENPLLLPEILALKARVLLAYGQISAASAYLQEADTYQDQSSPYITSANIDLALAEGQADQAHRFALSILPTIKDLYFDSLDDPFCVYTSACNALINQVDPAASYVLSHAQRQFTRLTNHLKSAEAKAAFLSIPHRSALMEIIHNQGHQPA
ncbi:MAG: hypothetical protein K0B06_12545 [Brevefilum sp.]|nr:hypothetical protein [Brevefilum sp.]